MHKSLASNEFVISICHFRSPNIVFFPCCQWRPKKGESVEHLSEIVLNTLCISWQRKVTFDSCVAALTRSHTLQPNIVSRCDKCCSLPWNLALNISMISFPGGYQGQRYSQWPPCASVLPADYMDETPFSTTTSTQHSEDQQIGSDIEDWFSNSEHIHYMNIPYLTRCIESISRLNTS